MSKEESMRKVIRVHFGISEANFLKLHCSPVPFKLIITGVGDCYGMDVGLSRVRVIVMSILWRNRRCNSQNRSSFVSSHGVCSLAKISVPHRFLTGKGEQS